MSDVMDSFRRAQGSRFAETFYKIFLDSDPRFRPMFKNTDFNRQRQLLLHGVHMLLDYAAGNAIGKMAIERLGTLHSRKKMNITEDMYPIWVDCLMKTLRTTDPEFSPKLEA
ncbi:MAG TPA: globin, partial [Nitrospiria bacterium]|nr:globin [Nitrospiria bacterium]